MNKEREIKFRVWSEMEKCFFYFDLQEIPHGVYGANSPAMQYIGITDKNGREIYEGDLIDFTVPGVSHGPEPDNYFSQEVYFDQESAAFLFQPYLFSPDEVKNIEVVGNIYENK